MIDILTAALCTNLRYPARAPDRFRRVDIFRALAGLVLMATIVATLGYMDRRNPHIHEAGLRATGAR